jgi:putative ABC transport system permease protein
VLLRAEEEAGVSRLRSPWLALASLGVAAVASTLPGIPPLPRLTVTLAAGLFGLERLARAWLPRLLTALRGPLEVLLPGLGRLGAASLAARPAQTSLAVVCVAGVVAGVTMSLVLGDIGASNLDGRMSSVYPSGILVTAGKIMGAQAEESISAETIAAIRDTPHVQAVFEHTSEKIVYRGAEVLIVGANMDVLAAFGRLSVVTGDPRAVATSISRGEIAISDGFARRFGAQVGDSLSLDTPKGARTFRVAGVIHDFAGPAGSINIDLSVFDQLWLRHGARDIVFWTEGDPEPVISEIRRRIGDTQSLFFVHGDALTHYASGFLRQFRGILMSVALMTTVLGGVAVWNLMLSAVTGRARELALLMCVGATERQLRMITLVDGALLGLCGGLVGIALGVLGAYSLVTRYIADALGWTLTFTVDSGTIAVLIAGIAAASLVATLYPAWIATRVPMREASSAD